MIDSHCRLADSRASEEELCWLEGTTGKLRPGQHAWRRCPPFHARFRGLLLRSDIWLWTFPPADRTPVLPVAFHQLAHGLGFETFTSHSAGGFFSGVRDIWSHLLPDASSGTTWRAMTSNARRAASAPSDPNLVWLGQTAPDKEIFLGPTPSPTIASPPPIAGATGAKPATLRPAVTPPRVSGQIATAEPALACDPITNPSALSGKIAWVDRGVRIFSVKVANAQAAGAIAVIVANKAAVSLPGMGGEDRTITLSSYGIFQSVGQAVSTALANGAVDAS